MIGILRVFLAGVFAAAVLAWGADNPATLQVRVVEGEGASYLIGSRATRGVTVLVSDEAGRPVEGAAVGFALPGDGPGGVFASGARTEIVTTRADGRAAVWGMQWNRTVGRFDLRIAAGKGPARAAVVSAQYLVGAPEGGAAASAGVRRSGTGSHKILLISVAVAGAAVGAVVGVAGGKSAPAAVAAASVSVTQIGTPSISLGRP